MLELLPELIRREDWEDFGAETRFCRSWQLKLSAPSPQHPQRWTQVCCSETCASVSASGTGLRGHFFLCRREKNKLVAKLHTRFIVRAAACKLGAKRTAGSLCASDRPAAAPYRSVIPYYSILTLFYKSKQQ